MGNYLGYEKSEKYDNDYYSSGHNPKTVKYSYGKLEIEVPPHGKIPFFAVQYNVFV